MSADRAWIESAARVVRLAMEQAWEEGYAKGSQRPSLHVDPNPYRRGSPKEKKDPK